MLRTGWHRVRSRTDRLGSVLFQSPLSISISLHRTTFFCSPRNVKPRLPLGWSNVSLGGFLRGSHFPAQRVEVAIDSDAIYCANDRPTRI